MSGAGAWDLPGDAGLAPTPLVGPHGPFVGTPPPARLPARVSDDPRLDALFRTLAEAYGRQHWWPAQTPFEVLVGAVLVQNTTWRNVERALDNLRQRDWLSPVRLCARGAAELADVLRPSGTYRVKAARLRALCQWYVEAGGLAALRERPLADLRRALEGVHGVGAETASAILCYAGDRAVAVVDVYARRVLARHGLVAHDARPAAVGRWLEERLLPTAWVHQEFHALCVRVGSTCCRPHPRCEQCPLPAPPSPQYKLLARRGRAHASRTVEGSADRPAR